jgi:two-component system, cell cycle response regulator
VADHLDRTQAVDSAILESVRGARPEGPAPGLVVLSGNEIGKVFYFDDKGRTIGRDPEAQIQLRDQSVSRRHAQVYEQKAEDGDAVHYLVVDLHSTNGTLVNGERISRAFLHDGDKIQFGQITLKFILHDEAEHRYQQEIQRRINFDDLTGLLTLNSFYERFDQQLRQAESRRSSLTVVMMDLDGLKRVNDLFGHLAGSFVIKTVGNLLRQNLEGFAEVGRYGGDEFIGFVPGLEAVEVRERLESLRRAIEQHTFHFKQKEAHVSISIGTANFPWDAHSFEELVAAADAALMRAKKAGKNRVEAFARDE